MFIYQFSCSTTIIYLWQFLVCSCWLTCCLSLLQFVTSALKQPCLEFELISPAIPKARVVPHFAKPGEPARTLQEEDLVPSALLKFIPKETDSVVFTGLLDELLMASEPLPSASQWTVWRAVTIAFSAWCRWFRFFFLKRFSYIRLMKHRIYIDNDTYMYWLTYLVERLLKNSLGPCWTGSEVGWAVL